MPLPDTPPPPPPLLTAVDCRGHIHLIVGSNSIANARCNRSIEVGATPKVIAPPDADVCYLLAKRIEDGEVEWIKRYLRDEDMMTLGREEVGGVVDAVFVTSGTSAEKNSLSTLCKRARIPINTLDSPAHCTFNFLSTHADGPLQIGITTSGNGCKLASRLRREIASTLPPHFGAIHRQILEKDQAANRTHHSATASSTTAVSEADQQEEEDDTTYATSQPSSFNRPPPSSSSPSDNTRRARWLAQICEYYPLNPHRRSLLLPCPFNQPKYHNPLPPSPFPPKRPPRIILAGAGPGAPSLLTLVTHHHIRTADLILADKLVPPHPRA